MNISGIVAYVIGFVLLLLYIMIYGSMYIIIGNSTDYSAYSNQLGIILGFGMLGCIALAGGMIAFVGAVFEFNVNTTIILSIVLSSLAVGTSTAALAIASITNQ